ncbi:ATP-binding protein [Ornithinibacillus sp. L9]|uniref:ATP-binding protein n=1 Tax=Ornithinibacillus caprae TaxID=2678566 RepID=A0A6N8FP92_9BACI|nr:ATP-binding protein [Ornithinibacillus caprae]MUK89278.1 ATP-binding protein [Ornithinibacillus caprae]
MEVSKAKFLELVQSGREDNCWDFKKEMSIKPKEKFNELIKDILAFSNSKGGYLLLGVDNNGNLTGVEEELDEANLGGKIESILGYAIDIKLLYFNHNIDDNEMKLGILSIPKSEKIRVSPKSLNGNKGIIVRENAIYVRRNTRSVEANSEDLETIKSKINLKGSYRFKEHDLQVIKRNQRHYVGMHKILVDYFRDNFSFNSNTYSMKLNEIFNFIPSKYNKLEFARIVGIEETKIDDHFEGKSFPTLEQLLRITLMFDLPNDFFFRPTIYLRYPIWQNPLVNFSIVDKVDNKDYLLNINEKDFFSDYFKTLAKETIIFTRFIRRDRPKREEISLKGTFEPRGERILFKLLEDLSDEKFEEYREQLSTQFYKILEMVHDENHIDAPEEFLYHLIGLDKSLLCRIINESTKEIKINKDSYHFYFNFIEEIKGY